MGEVGPIRAQAQALHAQEQTLAAELGDRAGLGAIERLNLALLVDRQHDGVRRWIDIEADDVAQLVDELRVVGELEPSPAVRLQPMRLPDARTALALTPAA